MSNCHCFVQDLACQVLKCFMLGNSMFLSLDNVLKLCWINILNHISHISKNYYMSFMTWFSKTWTQMNIQFWTLTLFCSRLGMPSFMFPSLDSDWTIQDLAFQVLKPFGVLDPRKNYVFHDLVFQDMIRRKWLSRLGKPISKI